MNAMEWSQWIKNPKVFLHLQLYTYRCSSVDRKDKV